MILRDEITTSDRLLKLIDFEKKIIDEKRNKIKSLMKDTEEGVQRYKLTNDIVIANTKRTIKVLTEKVLVATYTAGYPIEDFKKNLPSEFNDIEVDGIKDNSMTTDFMSTVDLYIKSKCNLIQEFSNIHAMAFTAKLDAVMDCNKQDKAILYKALDIIYREKRKK